MDMPPSPPPDSKPPRRGARPASLADTLDEADGRGRAVVATVDRDVRAALAAEQPAMELPRTRTPAEAKLREAIDEVRRWSREWHVAEQVARSLDAIADQLEEQRDEHRRRMAAIEGDMAAPKNLVRWVKTRFSAVAFAALGSVAAVIYGAGVKSGAGASTAAAAAAQTQAVHRHGVTLQRVCARDRDQDARLDEHDHLLSLPSRRRGDDLCDGADTP